MNIILYPRAYNKRGDENMHSVIGITEEGKTVNVKLRPTNRDKSSTSTIAEFSKTELDAINPCVASATNSKENREGVLLFTQCSPESKSQGEVQNFISKWATVLCHKSDSSNFLSHVGRLSIHEKAARLSEIDLLLKNEPSNKDDLIRERKTLGICNFPAIFYLHNKIQTFKSNETERLKSFILDHIKNSRMEGSIGGFATRLVNYNGLVKRQTYREFFQKYQYEEFDYEDPVATVERFTNSDFGKVILDSEQYNIEIIPLKKINSGRKVSSYYKNKQRLEKITKDFCSTSGSIKVCNVIAKTFRYQDQHNDTQESVMLDSLFTTSVSLGHPVRLDKNGELSLKLEGEDYSISLGNNDKTLISKTMEIESKTIANRDLNLLDTICDASRRLQAKEQAKGNLTNEEHNKGPESEKENNGNYDNEPKTKQSSTDETCIMNNKTERTSNTKSLNEDKIVPDNEQITHNDNSSKMEESTITAPEPSKDEVPDTNEKDKIVISDLDNIYEEARRNTKNKNKEKKEEQTGIAAYLTKITNN